MKNIVTIKTSADNLAKLAELLTYAYQEGNWQASGEQEISILFELDDVSIFQHNQGEEALSHEVFKS